MSYKDLIRGNFQEIYWDMARRVAAYKQIQQIANPDERRKHEALFLQEQKVIIESLIANEKRVRRLLAKALERQRQDNLGWWNKYKFRRIERNQLDRFDNIINLARNLREKLDSGELQRIGSQAFISKIVDGIKTITHLSDDYEIRRHAQGLSEYCRRNKSLVTALILLVLLSSTGVYTLTNYHIIPKNTQTTQARFIADDMISYDWAQGTHKSYGFHTMMERIIKHKSFLKGLQYEIKDDLRFGVGKIVSITKGAFALLPDKIRAAFGDNIIIEIQALNKGEIVITIYQAKISKEDIVVDIVFIQDKVGRIIPNPSIGNPRNLSHPELEAMYHKIIQVLNDLVNTN